MRLTIEQREENGEKEIRNIEKTYEISEIINIIKGHNGFIGDTYKKIFNAEKINNER